MKKDLKLKLKLNAFYGITQIYKNNRKHIINYTDEKIKGVVKKWRKRRIE